VPASPRCSWASGSRARSWTAASRPGSIRCGQLEQAGLRQGRTASRALGYQQLLRYLTGEWTLDQARAETVRATRRFARRQESWFRRDPRITWLDAPALATQALSLISQPSPARR
jgi:tRNA dimethylallyltransferase